MVKVRRGEREFAGTTEIEIGKDRIVEAADGADSILVEDCYLGWSFWRLCPQPERARGWTRTVGVVILNDSSGNSASLSEH